MRHPYSWLWPYGCCCTVTYFTDVNRKIPWCKKGPKAPNNKVQVIKPPPQPAKTKTGVSRAALKYEASDHIKRLAKQRPLPKNDDEKKFFSVKPLSLIYKPSPRIDELAKPRDHNTKKWSLLILVITIIIIYSINIWLLF